MPDPKDVQALQAAYPRLDALMCETLLSFSEVELEAFVTGEKIFSPPEEKTDDGQKQQTDLH